MAVRVGFNGFGRIGRNIFRVIYGRKDIEVRAIADVAAPENLAYLLNFDSIHGRFVEEVTTAAGCLFAGGKRIPIVSGKLTAPGDVKWRDLDVDIVIEASGRFRAKKELEKHLDAGARRVILTVPPRDTLDRTVVFGLNEGRSTRRRRSSRTRAAPRTRSASCSRSSTRRSASRRRP